VRQQFASGLTEHDPSRGPIEELDAEVSLERLNPVANRGLCEIQRLRSGGKTPATVDRQECVEVIGIHLTMQRFYISLKIHSLDKCLAYL